MKRSVAILVVAVLFPLAMPPTRPRMSMAEHFPADSIEMSSHYESAAKRFHFTTFDC